MRAALRSAPEVTERRTCMASRSCSCVGRGTEGVRRGLGICDAKDRLAGYEDRRTGVHSVPRVRGVDAAVDLDERRRPGLTEHVAHAAHFVEALANKGLAAKARDSRT